MNRVRRASQFSEISWIAALFGTAVGAGILYLPLQVGAALWALVLLSFLVFPLIYFAHRSIVTLLCMEEATRDYSGVVAHHLGRTIGVATVVVYFVTFYAVLTSYSIGLNANIGAYLFREGITATNWAKGPYLSLIILFCFGLLHMVGQQALLRVMTLLASILVVSLLGISIYLIPFWDFSTVRQMPSPTGLTADVLMVLPILTFSFVYFPAMSSMLAAYRSSGAVQGSQAEAHLQRIVLKTSAMLLIFVLFFVYSCIFSLTAAEFQHAIDENLNCLMILSQKEGISPALANMGALVGIAALLTSFVGVFFAVRDSAHELIGHIRRRWSIETRSANTDRKRMDRFILVFIVLTVWGATTAEPSVLNAFGLVISPLVAVFIFILPVVILVKARGWRTLRSPAYLFILCTGLLILCSYELGSMLKGSLIEYKSSQKRRSRIMAHPSWTIPRKLAA